MVLDVTVAGHVFAAADLLTLLTAHAIIESKKLDLCGSESSIVDAGEDGDLVWEPVAADLHSSRIIGCHVRFVLR